MYEGSGRYRHYKGGEYLVIGKAIREETKEKGFVEEVIYKPLSSGSMIEMLEDVTFWSRVLTDFNSDVELESGRLVPRFELIGRDDALCPRCSGSTFVVHSNRFCHNCTWWGSV